jgi:large subunit ribosomal protein L17
MLGRDSEHRNATRRNLAIALFTHGQITTTIPRAKSIVSFVEKIITTAKHGNAAAKPEDKLAARRRIIKEIGNPFLVDRDLKDYDRKQLKAEGYIVNRYHELQNGPRVVKKIMDEIAPAMADRDGGYTRIVKLAKHRIGDGGTLCVIMFVGGEEGPQVSGSFSRRREKAHRRTEYAAKLRKQKDAPKTEAAPAAPVEPKAE